MGASITVTDWERKILWNTQSLTAVPMEENDQVVLYPQVRRQEVHGFGGAFTEAAAACWQRLPEERRQAFLQCYFGPEGLGYTMGRVHLGSCDFALGHYSCLEGPEEEAEGTFHTERDEQYLLPLLQAAQEAAGQPLGLLLSTWSPPGFMKTNGERDHGGALKPEYWSLWAACLAKYAAYYQAKGFTVRAMTVQNEPAAAQTWDSCLYTAAEEAKFAVEELAPALAAAGCGTVGIFGWDHNKERLVARAQELMAVPEAERVFQGFAVHWYTGDHFEAIRLTREQWPGKEVWFSEGCVEYGRFADATPVDKAERYAHDLIGNLNAGVSASLDWNLLLDAQGGPNHVGNFCEAPVMLNDRGDDFCLQSEYYYIGHFSRWIRPGAVCLGSSSWTADLEVTAFQNPDGSRVTVLLNRTDRTLPVNLTSDGRQGYTFQMAPHTIATVEEAAS